MVFEKSHKKLAVALTVLLMLTIVSLFTWWWGAQTFHWVYGFLRGNILFALSWVLILVGCAVFIHTKNISRAIGFFIIGAGMTTLLISLFIPGYMVKQNYLEHSTTVNTSQSDVHYRERAPLDVAANASNRYLGDTTGDTTGSVKSLPLVGEHGVYNTSIIRRGVAQGYESTQSMEVPLTGSITNKQVKFCEFNPEAKLRLGGMTPWNNLWRSIAWRTNPGVSYSKSDAFVYCESNNPYVVVPLKQISGGFFPYKTPYGAAVYNGTTGELDIVKDFKDSDYPFVGKTPLYPQSLATKQREAFTAAGSFFDYLFQRSGFEDTSSDANYPNQDNRAEFSLASPDGKQGYYVTPLTSRGSTSTIIALGDVRSDSMTPGELNTYTIHRFADGDARQANSSIAQRITGEVLSGYKAQGLSVFEIVPADNGNWVATIGNEQSILYRAYINSDGKITLEESHEAPQGDTQPDNPQGNPQGQVSMDLGKPVEELTTEEITQHIAKLVEELESRTKK